MGDKFLLEVSDLLGLDGVQVSADTGIDDADLLADGHGLVLVLFQQLGEAGTTGEELKRLLFFKVL